MKNHWNFFLDITLDIHQIVCLKEVKKMILAWKRQVI